MSAKPFEKTQFRIGQNIKQWRVLKNCKQQTLANHLKVTKAIISNIENDKSDICLSRIEAIANFLGISILQLFQSPEDTFNNKDQPGTDENMNSFTQELIKEILQQLKNKDQVINNLTNLLNRIPFHYLSKFISNINLPFFAA